MNNESLEIILLFQNRKSILFYAYCDANDLHLMGEYLEQHKSVFTDKEYEDLYVGKRKFEDSNEKRSFERKFSIYKIDYYQIPSVLMTGIEKDVYHETLYEWYNMYKDVIIASQILPYVIEGEPIKKLKDVGCDMYKEVECFDDFTRLLSTKYIKNNLLLHPLTVLNSYKENKSMREHFRYQMFKDD